VRRLMISGCHRPGVGDHRLLPPSVEGALVAVVRASPDVDGEGGERAVPSFHGDKLHQLVVDDACNAARPWSVDCGDGGND
jgi:hypothetical protein